jgi:hypothetical protein
MYLATTPSLRRSAVERTVGAERSVVKVVMAFGLLVQGPALL